MNSSKDTIIKKGNTPVISENMTAKEADDFVNNLSSSISGELIKAKMTKTSPAQVLEMTNMFVNKALDLAKFIEAQKTKREEIRAKTKIAIHQIDALRDFLNNYLEKTFDERSKIFAKEFEVVDRCLDEGNTAGLSNSLNSITELAKSSPFKALSDIASVKGTFSNHGTLDI